MRVYSHFGLKRPADARVLCADLFRAMFSSFTSSPGTSNARSNSLSRSPGTSAGAILCHAQYGCLTMLFVWLVPANGPAVKV